MEFLDMATTPQVPWKNGGGSTQELVCWPPGAGMEHFDWRVSVATIARPGPFSAFPGVDRQIMLLKGDGVALQGAGGHWQHVLAQPWQPFVFSGDEPVDCRMLGGVSTDFNLMVRRGGWRGTLQVVRGAPPPAMGVAGLCMVLQGSWQWGGGHGVHLGGTPDGKAPRVLKTGQGIWWMDEETEGGQGDQRSPAMVPLHPLGAAAGTGSAGDSPVLAWVALCPALDTKD
ncbi:hypothetical protein CLU85_1997 [Acidovorax sp. 69]|uniref:HutD/Ves family protein n=1 Tax=Acidovorax sp. 69 TaxID=2035202 RepID=UPI000C235F60|nr:HutD family protein [Acidovorax sp. 69]PJI97222.1 hypothetical protein CLU85_1997 [Acidovorax sp. 69]